MTDPIDPYAAKPWLDSYEEGVPTGLDLPRISLTQLLEETIARFGSRTALEFFGSETSYDQLGEQIARVAEGLREIGVGKGDRVALVLPSCPQHIVAFYAVLRLGAVVVEHNPIYTPRELHDQFADHGADVALVWDKVADVVAGFDDTVRPRRIVAVDITRDMPLRTRVALRLPIAKARESRAALTATPTAQGLIAWGRLAGSRPLAAGHPVPSPDDTALLQYTNGTTGKPKGAILSHHNLRMNAAQGRAWLPDLREGEEIFYGILPLFHAYGVTLCLTFAMSIGARLVLFPKFDATLVLDAAKKSPPTFLPAVPPMYEALVRGAGQRGVDLGSIRFAISGAMSLPVKTVERWETATGGVLVEGYGMTEASPIIACNPAGPARRAGTVGIPFPDVEVRIVDPDDLSALRPIGEPGELVVRGPQVFGGYWNRPDDTAETLLEGGWLRTGDIVTMSADGFITVVDRRKELIITGGFNVSPTEVEEALLAHPGVVAAAVVGLPRGGGGEDVAAAVVLREGAAFDAHELRAFARNTLADYKIPKRIVVRESMPTSLIGKVLRRIVRDEMIAGR